MALEAIKQVVGKAVRVPGDAIDTDRIIPARFMKCVTFDGLGEYLFYDVRKNEDGSDRPHPLNESAIQAGQHSALGLKFRVREFPGTRPPGPLPLRFPRRRRGKLRRDLLWQLHHARAFHASACPRRDIEALAAAIAIDPVH